MDDVEEGDAQTCGGAVAPAAEAGRRVLEGLGRAVLADAEELAVEHDRSHRERRQQVAHGAQSIGHVVEVAGVEANLVAVAVRLDADAVELPLDRRGPGAGEGLGDVGRRGGQHGLDPDADGEPDGVDGGGALHERQPGAPGEVAAQHGGTADRRRRDRRCGGDRLGHHTRQRSLAQLADEEPAHEARFGRRQATAQVVDDRPARRLGARPADDRERSEVGVEVRHGHRRPFRRPVDGRRRPPHPDTALGDDPDQIRHRRHDLVLLEPDEQLGQGRGLGAARARRRNGAGGRDEVGEQQHPTIVAVPASPGPST
ncbi:MAG: hypothetical protein V9G12_13260 [Microthrixaceae bacterium]